MKLTKKQIKQIISEELTKTDKAEIKRMVRKELEKEMKSKLKKAVEEAVAEELKGKAAKEQIADVSKTIIKKQIIAKNMFVEGPAANIRCRSFLGARVNSSYSGSAKAPKGNGPNNNKPKLRRRIP